MLWIEVVSVSLIAIVLVILPIRFGLHLDHGSVPAQGRHRFSALGPALVLSMFSFVGFESRHNAGRRSA